MVIPCLIGVTLRVQVLVHGACVGACVHAKLPQTDRQCSEEVWTRLCFRGRVTGSDFVLAVVLVIVIPCLVNVPSWVYVAVLGGRWVVPSVTRSE